MKHVTFGEKSLLMGDDAADSLLDYARLLAIASTADTVTVRAIGADGNTVDAAFLLNPSTVMVVESTNSTVVPPPNDEAVPVHGGPDGPPHQPPKRATRKPRRHPSTRGLR